jgi:hypothetical protein
MSMPSTLPDEPSAGSSLDGLSPRRAQVATLWILCVTIGYLGTIVYERGDRIVRILEDLVSR